MQLKKIRVRIDETINLGNYESIKPSVELEAELEPGDDPTTCSVSLHSAAQEMWARSAMSDLKSYIRHKGVQPENFSNLLKGLGEMIKG